MFGAARIKKEGCAVHPDYIDKTLTNREYIEQAVEYYRDTGDYDFDIARDDLIPSIKEKLGLR